MTDRARKEIWLFKSHRLKKSVLKHQKTKLTVHFQIMYHDQSGLVPGKHGVVHNNTLKENIYLIISLNGDKH